MLAINECLNSFAQVAANVGNWHAGADCYARTIRRGLVFLASPGGGVRPQTCLTAVLFSAISAGAALGQTSKNAEDGILAADLEWEKVYSVKDLDRSVAFCDEEVSMLVPNTPIATGKAAVAKAIASDFAHGNLAWHPNKAGVARSGELGYTTGTYEQRFKNASGKTVLDKGKYLTVWKKQLDGTWKVLFDMFNSDLP